MAENIDFEGDSDSAVARHEIGHAAVAVLVGGTFVRVTVNPAQHDTLRSRGHVEGVEASTDFDRATIFMAGMFAADQRDGFVNANGCSHDIQATLRLGTSEWLNTEDATVPAGRAKQLVDSFRIVIDALAAKLVEVRELSFEEVRAAVSENTDDVADARS